MLGKAGDGEPVLERAAVGVAQPPGARPQRSRRPPRRRRARTASGARPGRPRTAPHEATRQKHDVVALAHSGHALAERRHHARRPRGRARSASARRRAGRRRGARRSGRPRRRRCGRGPRRARGGSSSTVSTAGGRPGLAQDAGAHLESGPGRRSAQRRVGHPWTPRTGGVVAHGPAAVKRITRPQTPNCARTASMRMTADALGSRRRGWHSAIVRGISVSLGSSQVSEGSTAPEAPSRSRHAWP